MNFVVYDCNISQIFILECNILIKFFSAKFESGFHAPHGPSFSGSPQPRTDFGVWIPDSDFAIKKS